MGHYKLPRYVAFAAIQLLLISSSILAQNLKAVRLAAKLPTGRGDANALYDGDDTIYIFGGFDNNSVALSETVKYSISQDMITPAGHLPLPNYGAGAVINDRNQIFYLPGFNSDNNTYQYFPDSQTFTKVSRLSEMFYYATIKTNGSQALLVGGYGDGKGYNILSLDMHTLTSKNIQSLAEEVRMAQGIWVEDQESAYIFYGRGKIQKFNKTANTSEVLPITMSMSAVQAVWDGSFGYILPMNGSYATVNDIIQFDPFTQTLKYIPVDGYPGRTNMGFERTTAVYVEKLNRIYMFGGSSSGSFGQYIWHDSIHYISLDPVSPPITTPGPPTTSTMNPGIFDCCGKPDTVFPHPEDCSKFIICRDNHAHTFQCPDNLLFHPFMHCTFPDWVVCSACNYTG